MNISTSLQDEGQATLTTPPNIPSFDVANKAHFLYPTWKAQPPPALTLMPSVDVNSITSILLFQMLTNSGLLQSTSSSPAAKAPPPIPSAAPAPAPPSPPLPSPMQPNCFLLYAETDLRVCNASQYDNALGLQGIGPDVLADMSDHILSKVGIPVSDIIHLKKGSVAWWNSLHAKQKCYGRGGPYFILPIFSCQLHASLSLFLQWLCSGSLSGLSWRSRHSDLDLQYDFLS